MNLLLDCEVRWLPKAKALKRVIMLKNKVVIFLTEKNSDLATILAITTGF